MKTQYYLREAVDNFIIFKQNGSVTGKESMVLLANGVKARCIMTKDETQVITEFLFDKNKFTKEAAKEWTKQHAETMEKGLQEAAPKGSFFDTTLKVQDALNLSSFFPKNDFGESMAFIQHMFEDHAIVSSDNKDFKIPFTINSEGIAELEAPIEVRPEFVEEKNEKKNIPQHFALYESFENSNLKEAKFDKTSRKLVAVLIEKGMNFDKKRFYPEETIKEAAPLFAGIKMFIDHPTDKEDREKPERSVRDEVAIIEKSWFEDGKIMAQIHVHDEWFVSKLDDPVFRENIGISINASGKRSFQEMNGEQVEVIEKIASPRSVDWVTEAGARGRVEYLIESAKQKEGDIQMLKDITLAEVRKDRPDLIETIKESVREEVKAEQKDATEKAIKEGVEKGVKEATEKQAEETKQAGFQAKIKGLFEAAKLPGVAILKFCEEYKTKTFKSEEDLQEQVKETVKRELTYLASVGGVKLTSEGTPVESDSVKESATKDLMESLNIKVEEKKDEE